MNLYDLVSQTLTQGRLNTTNAVKRSKYQNSLIVPALNDAYKKMCREKLHPWYWEAVTLDANKCFVTSALSKTFVKVNKITTYQDFTEDAGYAEQTRLPWGKYDDTGTIIVPSAEASGTVYVKYEYMPTMLGISYNISGANTTVSIPVDEAISAAEALALVGLSLYLLDVSLGTYKEYTIVSATAGAAGAAAIVVTGAPAVATVDGDEIYIGDEWEPIIEDDYHGAMTYWATSEFFRSLGPNYGDWANDWANKFYTELGYVTNDMGEAQGIVGAYSPQI
jgi:hypothetical protein